MIRLLLIAVGLAGWCSAAWLLWLMGRAYHNGYCEGREETFAEMGVAL